MVNSSAVKKLNNLDPKIRVSDLPNNEIKWCVVTLADVIKTGKRLEASVFDVESRNALAIISECKHPKEKLIGMQSPFIQRAYYGGRLKRNYISSEDDNAVGFIGSSEMLDIYPKPVNFMDKREPKIESLRVNEGTILISRSGTIGNLTYVNRTLSKLLVSEHAIRLESAENCGFIYCFLKSHTGQALIKSKIYGAVIQEIEPEHLAEIFVPNPPNEIKHRINDLIMRSFDLRDQSNELIDKASKLLKSALNLPPISEIEVAQFDRRYDVNNYDVKLSKIDGRLDGSYHVPIVDSITELLKKNAAEVATVGDKRISKEIILPGRFKRVYVDEGQGRVFFGGKQIFELDPSNKKYLSLTQHAGRIKKQLELHENMTLVTCSGTIGKVTLVPRHWENWTANQHIIRIVPANNNIAGYISIFLGSEYGYSLITRHTYGSVVDEVDANHISKVPIPLLKDGQIQLQINNLAIEANALRYKAYQFEQEAMKIMNEEAIFA